MHIEKAFLRSKVARRIFFLFVTCAIIPITVLAIICLTQVTNQLSNQSQERLLNTAKDMEMGIRERLFLIEDEMKMVAATLRSTSADSFSEESLEFSAYLRNHFKCLGLINNSRKYISLFGRSQRTPYITPAEKEHLLSGKFLISTEYRPENSSHVYMVMALNPGYKGQEILLAEINPVFLWYGGHQDSLPAMTELCILDESNNLLESSLITLESFPEQDAIKLRAEHSGRFEWRYEEKELLASYRSVSLKEPYFMPTWALVLSQPKSYVFQPVALFKQVFPFIILMSLLVVILLSFGQIRRNLIPLERLKAGTQRIAKRDFDSRVRVNSNDEFEDLAESFNTMANQLGRQFKALMTIGEIDRTILSALDTKKIADTVITRMNEVVPCNAVTATLLDSNASNKGETYIWEEKPNVRRLVETVELRPEDIQILRDNKESLFIEQNDTPPNYLAPLAKHGIRSFLILPIFLKQNLAGIITLGYIKPPVLSSEDVYQARQLVDQVAIAISNAHLIEELNDLNWGTLTALARTIDAKSPWTAGHSERVTKLALKIGRAMGLSKKEMDNLHRGGLLHDIGKLGIPPAILDKPGKLTPEETHLMNKHVQLGARILKPIAAYTEVIPIITHHHERFDGSGYPDGLSEGAISLGGHIYAVADDFDACTSERPYRKALSRNRTINLIKKGAGSKYNPRVVEAFLEIMAKEERGEKHK